MTEILRIHSRRLIALAVALALAITALIASTDDADAGITSFQATGISCFDVGQRTTTYAFGGPAFKEDIKDLHSAFATAADDLGRGAAVQFVKLNKRTDTMRITLTKPATKAGCVNWHVQAQTTFG